MFNNLKRTKRPWLFYREKWFQISCGRQTNRFCDLLFDKNIGMETDKKLRSLFRQTAQKLTRIAFAAAENQEVMGSSNILEHKGYKLDNP